MCGICGKLSFKEGIEPRLIERMCAAIAHRGPDDEGWYVKGPIALGNRRLAIIDLSAAGHQPMSTEDQRLWLTYNGEVYNYREVREELQKRGHVFRSNTDTEVVLKGYQEWGTACLSHFNGMFAFAIWDEGEQTLFLARDRMGIKPLYYYLDDYQLVFSSEIKAILVDAQVKRELDGAGLVNYFTFGHATAPDTIFRGIKKLLPGHFMLCRRGAHGEARQHIEAYWTVPMPGSSRDLGEHYYAENTRNILKAAVERHLIADVPVGVFLSGGIDSSAIVGIVASSLGRRVKTFSIGFESPELGYDELRDAREVARYFGTDHHEMTLTDDDLGSVLDDLVYAYDEPFGDAAAFPSYLLARFARSHVPVALTGEGSDEVFGGYRRYVAEQWASAYQCIPDSLRRFLGFVVTRSRFAPQRLKRAVRVLDNPRPLDRYLSWLVVFNQDMLRNLLAEDADVLGQATGRCQYSRLYGADGRPSIDRLLYVDQQTWLPDTYLEKVDKAMMAASLEGRVPFLDVELIRFAATIPAKYKVRGLRTKYILKKALEGILPPSTLSKPKHGFSVPLAPWFRGKLGLRVREILLDPRTRSRGLFDHRYIDHLYTHHLDGTHNYYRQLWLLVVFEIWCRQYLDRSNILTGSVQR